MSVISPKPVVLWSGVLALLSALVISGIHPYDRPTWWLEVFPVLLAVPLLWATHKRFPLTSLLYALVFVHCLILIGGGAYTYARVPLGNMVRDWFSLQRNPYDKLGHFAQGFVPVMIAREILIRGKFVTDRKMLAWICVSMALAVSSVYEMVEWAAGAIMGQGADEFLGTQGDSWDTQSDMFFALVGAVVALAMLSKWHDRQLHQV
ncbi:MAG: DUF2238 domain-containing protein [Luteolibacter sp.]